MTWVRPQPRMKAANSTASQLILEHGPPSQEEDDGHGYREIGHSDQHIRDGVQGDEIRSPEEAVAMWNEGSGPEKILEEVRHSPWLSISRGSSLTTNG